MTDARTPRSLQVERSRRGRILLWIVAVAVPVAFGAWFVTHPPLLPLPEQPVEIQIPLGEAEYVGIYDPAADDDRTLHISQVAIDTSGEVTVAALVCRDGTVSETNEPETFCTNLVEAEGATLEPGDGLVLEILEDEPGDATIE
ncbi:MAG: hypothetical protein ACRDOZ_06320, partial [Nocardioides sp.]